MSGTHNKPEPAGRSEPHSYRRDSSVPAFDDDRPIVVFDGYCALCSGWAKFVLKHDREARYRLLLAQSELGRALYVHYGLDPQDYETNILLADGRAWFRSEGSIRMAEGLGFPWSLARIFRVFPRRVRDALYLIVARHRFSLFGRRESCYLPDEESRKRFLNWTESK